MRPPIAPQRIAHVLRLLAGGKSQRQAADIAGVSLPIVNQIAQGQRGIQFSEDAQDFQTVNAYTCPGCHRLVTTAPCVACASKRGA